MTKPLAFLTKLSLVTFISLATASIDKSSASWDHEVQVQNISRSLLLPFEAETPSVFSRSSLEIAPSRFMMDNGTMWYQNLIQNKVRIMQDTPAAPKEPWKPKGVFAHFMVSNVHSWTQFDWIAEMKVARGAGIDAFVLNMAYNEGNGQQIQNAFDAAGLADFSLLFSFDYADKGPWPVQAVIDLVKRYGALPQYYKYQSKPFVSTFEGPASAKDWIDIKKVTNCFFMPDWSSLGAEEALKAANGVADGLFSWAAWPWGDRDMNTFVDASYLHYLRQAGEKPYMMPVSPWFYTDMPGFGKNWVWRGDDLWRDRWEQVLVIKPDWVQIVSWNDYGESHYIGPIHPESMVAFGPEHGRSKYNYALDFPHDGWRTLLPFYISLYKYGKATITNQRLVAWYRPVATDSCKDVSTTGNTASQLQLEFHPAKVMQDQIFFSALLVTSDSSISISIGGTSLEADFHHKPEGQVGIYHGSVDMKGLRGVVDIRVKNSRDTLSLHGRPISTSCATGQNWNAWVTSTEAPELRPRGKYEYSILNLQCVEGTAPKEFETLCTWTCKRGYCPVSACHCTKQGVPPTVKQTVFKEFYPAAGKSSNFKGLCDFACQRGYCPRTYCSPTKQKLNEPTVSPFLEDACTGGTGEGQFKALCEWTCKYGFCPRNNCKCTAKGNLRLFEGFRNPRIIGVMRDGSDDGNLCAWACTRDFCPRPTCSRGNLNADGEMDWDTDLQTGKCKLDEKTSDLLKLDAIGIMLQGKRCQAKQLLITLGLSIKQAQDQYKIAMKTEILGTDVGAFNRALKNYIALKKEQITATMEYTWFKNGGLAKYFTCTLAENTSSFGNIGKVVRCPSVRGGPVDFSMNVVLNKDKEKAFWADLAKDYGIYPDMLFTGGGDYEYGVGTPNLSGINGGIGTPAFAGMNKGATLFNFPTVKDS